MDKSNTIVGLDVHKKAITAAVLPRNAARPKEVVTIENDRNAIKRFVTRVTVQQPATFVYEAGPCGYEVHRQITALGYPAVVIAPAMTPIRPGDRVKTNRRDAEKLARLYRAGELTEIRVPSRFEEAARDLVRAREDAVADRLRARHRLNKFLLRQGRVFYEATAWGVRHRQWLRAQRFDLPLLQDAFAAYLRAVEEAEDRLASLEQQVLALAQTAPYQTPVRYLRCLKGIDTLSALTILVETQDFRRFPDAPAYMTFTGLVSSENSSGDRVHRGPITKAGNAHLRRVLVEASWTYRGRNVTGRTVGARRQGCPPRVVQIARRAQDRLHRKFWRLTSRGKLSQVATVAVARELAGFIWAIAQEIPTTPAA